MLTVPWMYCTLQPLLRHAEEAGKAAGGSTLFIFTSDHGDGYTDKGHAYEPSNPSPNPKLKPRPRPKPKPMPTPKPKPKPKPKPEPKPKPKPKPMKP